METDQPITSVRIPHFFQSPDYVYQHATCFASTAKLVEQIGGTSGAGHPAAVARYLDLLRSGGSDHPMTLLKREGVDLAQPDTASRLRRSRPSSSLRAPGVFPRTQ